MSQAQESKHEGDDREATEESKRESTQASSSVPRHKEGKETIANGDQNQDSGSDSTAHQVTERTDAGWCRCRRGRQREDGSPSKNATKSKHFRELDATLQSLIDEIEQTELEQDILPQRIENCKRAQFWSFMLFIIVEAILIKSFWPPSSIDRIRAVVLLISPVLLLVLQAILRIRTYLYTKKRHRLNKSLEESKKTKAAKILEAKKTLPFEEFVIIAGKFDAESDHSMLKPDIRSQQRVKEEEGKREKLFKLMEQSLQLNLRAFDGDEIREAISKALADLNDKEKREFEEGVPSLSRVTNQTFDDKLVRSLTSTKKPRTRRASAGVTMRPNPRNLNEEFSGFTDGQD